MLHFGIPTENGHPSVWGAAIFEQEQEPGHEFFHSRMDISARDSFAGNAGGQYLGAFGTYRTEFGWPLREMLSGAYLFNTYVTTYYYLDGDYTLAIQTLLSLTDGFNFSSTDRKSVV
jgi:hypothetical protein